MTKKQFPFPSIIKPNQTTKFSFSSSSNSDKIKEEIRQQIRSEKSDTPWGSYLYYTFFVAVCGTLYTKAIERKKKSTMQHHENFRDYSDRLQIIERKNKTILIDLKNNFDECIDQISLKYKLDQKKTQLLRDQILQTLLITNQNISPDSMNPNDKKESHYN